MHAAYVEARGGTGCLVAGLAAGLWAVPRKLEHTHPGLLASVPPMPPVALADFVTGAGWGSDAATATSRGALDALPPGAAAVNAALQPAAAKTPAGPAAAPGP